MSSHYQEKIRKLIEKGEKIDSHLEYKQQKRQNIILDKADEFLNNGFKKIILAGYSAGGWASLNLISKFPDKFKGAIAINPAFAGHKIDWERDPEWGFLEINKLIFLNKKIL